MIIIIANLQFEMVSCTKRVMQARIRPSLFIECERRPMIPIIWNHQSAIPEATCSNFPPDLAMVKNDHRGISCKIPIVCAADEIIPTPNTPFFFFMRSSSYALIGELEFTAATPLKNELCWKSGKLVQRVLEFACKSLQENERMLKFCRYSERIVNQYAGQWMYADVENIRDSREII